MMSYEREILIEAVKNAQGNQAKAARTLGTTPRILSYRLRRHGLHGTPLSVVDDAAEG
jgi:Nif-specific regulatory protein